MLIVLAGASPSSEHLAGAHEKASVQGVEPWHVQVGECSVVIHLWASAWRAVSKGAGTAEVPC